MLQWHSRIFRSAFLHTEKPPYFFSSWRTLHRRQNAEMAISLIDRWLSPATIEMQSNSQFSTRSQDQGSLSRIKDSFHRPVFLKSDWQILLWKFASIIPAMATTWIRSASVPLKETKAGDVVSIIIGLLSMAALSVCLCKSSLFCLQQ